MKTILVLTDFSKKAEYAAEYAMHIAIKSQANLLLCYAMELPDNHGANRVELNRPTDDHAALKNEIVFDLVKLGKRLEKISKESDTFKPLINYITDFGPIAEVAGKVIAEKSVDLVVIGSHKSYGLTRFIYGSHILTILDKLNCPVLLVPENLKFKGINSVAYTTDLSFDNTKVISYLGEIAKPFNAAISINHISPLEATQTEFGQTIKYLKILLNSYQPRVFYHTIKGDNIKHGLLERAGSERADILVLVHKRYDFLDRLFHASVSTQIADSVRIPLLVLPHSFSLDGVDFTDDQSDHFSYKADDSGLLSKPVVQNSALVVQEAQKGIYL